MEEAQRAESVKVAAAARAKVRRCRLTVSKLVLKAPML